MKKETFLKYFFKGRMKYTSLVLILFSLIALIMEIFRQSKDWYISLVFLFIGVVIVPFGAYMNYKGYWR